MSEGATVRKLPPPPDEPGTDLARLEDFNPAQYIVLHPVMLQTAGGLVSPVLVEAISVVQINPNPNAGDLYHDFRFAPADKGVGALTGQGLAKIAAAAGIQWDPQLCRVLARQRTADGHVYVAYQAAGRVRQANGEYHVEIASADMDTADEAERIEDAYRRKVSAGRAKYGLDAIPDMVRREVLQLKQFALRQVETKAKNRVIRRLLSLRQTYELKDLAKPFVVPRLMYRPEAALAALEGSRAAEEIYGSPSLPAATAGAGESDRLSGSTVEAGRDQTAPAGGSASSAPASTPVSEGKAGGSTGRRSGTTDDRAESEDTPRLSGKEERSPEFIEGVDGPPVPEKPKVNPKVEGGPFNGQFYSEIIEQAQGEAYLQGVANEGKTVGQRKTASAWLQWKKDRDQPRLA